MIKVISFKICPFVQRVTALLEAKNISYELEYISLSDKPDWFLDISPNAQVPVLVTEEGTALFESDAIVEYLEEAYPPLRSEISLEEKAQNRAWSYLATKNYLVQCSAQRSPSREELQNRSQKLNRAFSAMEKQLGKGPYFSGDEMSLVDLSWLVLLHRADIIEKHSGYDFLESFPKMKRWQTAVLATGLQTKSVADDFKDAFSSFYLSESTFLGRGENTKDFSLDKARHSGSCC
ncbi:MAG: glutathione S-transferase family protein [Sneathiellales bacterium]|nr:glutathione S-transferase family protein [Sneathiellales bacterium]